MPRLTILICTHDRAGLLEKTLASLNAAFRPLDWEVDILVVANACNDDTHALLEGYGQAAVEKGWLPLAWYAEPTAGKSHALNSAMPRLAGEVVAFVDDDHRVAEGYLQAICAAAEAHPDADLFCGRILPDWDGSEPGWVHDRGPYRIYPLPVPRYDLGDEPCVIDDQGALPGGGNLFLRTPWLRRVGPFATDYGPVGHNLGGAEDLEWVRRALALGARLRYAPEVVQYHYVDQARLALGYLLHKAYERSASSIRLRKSADRVPLFAYRKAAAYLVQALFSLSWPRSRFFLVRLAAALGEIKGFRQVAREAGARTR